MLYERFSPRARKVMYFANQEAQRFNHDSVNSCDLLLGLLKEGTGTAVAILKLLLVDVNAIHRETETACDSGGPIAVSLPADKLPQTSGAKKAITLAIESAKSLSHDYVGTEHILDGLVTDLEGGGGQLLRNHGVTSQLVRSQIVALLQPGQKQEMTNEDFDRAKALYDALLGSAKIFVDYLRGIVLVQNHFPQEFGKGPEYPQWKGLLAYRFEMIDRTKNTDLLFQAEILKATLQVAVDTWIVPATGTIYELYQKARTEWEAAGSYVYQEWKTQVAVESKKPETRAAVGLIDIEVPDKEE